MHMNIAHQAGSLARIGGYALAGMLTLGATMASAVTLSNQSGQGNKLQSETLKFGNYAASVSSMGAMAVTDGASNFWVYCLDPLTTANLPNTYNTTNLANFITGTGSNTYTALFTNSTYTAAGTYALQNTANVLNKLQDLYSHAYNDSLNSATKSAAFQYAIWEIEGDTGYSSTAGGLKYTSADSAFITQVNAYLTALNSGNWSSVNGVNLGSTSAYTYTVYTPATSSQVFLRVSSLKAPEPSSVALAGLALFGVAVSRRKKAKA